jgi:hypothetical protein
MAAAAVATAAAVEPANSITSDATSVLTSAAYNNSIAEDTAQRSITVSKTLQQSSSSIATIPPPPPAEVFNALIRRQAYDNSNSSYSQQAQSTAAVVAAVLPAVEATATVAAVTPDDDTATFIGSVLAQRHTLPTAKLSSSELTNVIALARQSVAAEPSAFNNDTSATAARTNSSVTADTRATDNTVIVDTSSNTELAATSDCSESTLRGSAFAVLSNSESAATVQAAHSARSSSSSSSSCVLQTLRKPTRRADWTPMPGEYGSVDRVLQCEADSYSNATAYKRSMSAGVGSTCNAPAREKDNAVSSKCSTAHSKDSTQAAAAVAYRLLNCSDSSDDDVSVHTPLANDSTQVVTEVVDTDHVPLAISTQTNSSCSSNSNIDNTDSHKNASSSSSNHVVAITVDNSVTSSSSSSTDISYDIVSTPAAVTSAHTIVSTLSTATSKKVSITDTVVAGATKVAAAVIAATSRRERSRSPARTGSVRAASPSPTRGVSRSVVVACTH